jgi:hypothetical protein
MEFDGHLQRDAAERSKLYTLFSYGDIPRWHSASSTKAVGFQTRGKGWGRGPSKIDRVEDRRRSLCVQRAEIELRNTTHATKKDNQWRFRME